MSVVTVCPYCNAKLRIGNPKPGSAIRVKCRECKAHFHPTVAMTPAAAVAPPIAARPPVAAEHDDAAEAAADERHARRRARRHAARQRLREQQKRSRRKPLRPAELLLAGALVFGGVGAAGILAWKALAPADAPVPVAAAEDVPPPNPDTPIESALATNANRPLPPRLFGLWDLRSDDLRRGTLEFRPNGTVTARAWQGDVERPSFEGRWFVTDEKGNDLTIEAGAGEGIGTPGHMLLSLTITSPEAFTVRQTIMFGLRNLDPQRFVRRPDRTSEF